MSTQFILSACKNITSDLKRILRAATAVPIRSACAPYFACGNLSIYLVLVSPLILQRYIFLWYTPFYIRLRLEAPISSIPGDASRRIIVRIEVAVAI